MSTLETTARFFPALSRDEEQPLIHRFGSRLAFGAAYALAATEQLSLQEVEARYASLNDDTLSKALTALAASADFAPLYSLSVLMSQATVPLSEKDLDSLWTRLPFPDSYPSSCDDLLLILLRLGFVEPDESCSEPKYRLNDRVKHIVLRYLSDADMKSANMTFASFYNDSKQLDQERVPKWHHHLIAAGLYTEATQLITAYSQAFIRANLFQTAFDMLDKTLSSATNIDQNIALFLRHQLATASIALENYPRAIKEMKTVSEAMAAAGNQAGAIATAHQLAAVYAMNGDDDLAMRGFQGVMRAHEAVKNISGVAAAAAQIGMLALTMNNPALAVEHFYIAKRLSETLSADEKNISEQNWAYLQEQLGADEFGRLFSSQKLSAERYCETLSK
ncbi:MAG: hypothetical protein HY22_05270 [[Candidatus Thermochlorobacteriaceae] bacterium GBChlB]|nr:MAG: hypothetical protein HY22_05270 [[Candidatus Thermochlorobacteriaceae] bacterium GBChlB]